MTPEFERWAMHQERLNSIRDLYLPRIIQWHQTADNITRLMLNTLFVLHGGGIIVLPTLKAVFPTAQMAGESMVWSAALFVVGLFLAMLAGVVAIWNVRILAGAFERSMEARLREANARALAMLHATPFQELASEHQSPERIGRVAMPATSWISWVCGLLSALAFVLGAALLGGDLNPLCQALDRVGLCFGAAP